MSRKKPSLKLRNQVSERAVYRCEYCKSLKMYAPSPFNLEHIIPISKNGLTILSNLAFSCYACNRKKSDKLVFPDPLDGELVPFFNPRKNDWATHFAWSEDDLLIIGLSPIGRATVEGLQLLKEYIKKKIDVSAYYQNKALEIHIKFKGKPKFLYQELKKREPNSEELIFGTLVEFLLKNASRKLEKILLTKLRTPEKKENQLIYAKYLLRLGNLDGLNFLYQYIKSERKSPFSNHIANLNLLFENPKGLPILLKILNLGNAEDIPKDIFSNIPSVASAMISHLAYCKNGTYFFEVTKTLRYILKDIEFKYYQKQKVQILEAINIWEKFKVL